ncbi:MAG: O-antigen ligase domain-containing protein [Planctomycetota bacterium]|mgnify:CR=1 FL=1|nr:MAG: O-antigen ligase domain-containing protein [Planctomycetota bacterium]REK20780.1 MAG: O-antigen ligase domain-containing protein [Planctomycetota bacterium]REK38038.1 MAG: O-antigen ligase domain-containing protein [Planctomycetota bacterium]
MAYVLFLLANAALFVRPAELSDAFHGVQLYLYLIAAAILCSVRGIHNQLSLRTMVQQPINLCVAGLIVAVVASHVSRGQIGLAANGLVMMVKVVLYYAVLVSVINTPERLRTFLKCTALCATAMVAFSLQDYFRFVSEWSGRDDIQEIKSRERWLPPEAPRLLRHVPEIDGVDSEGGAVWIFRLCGLGIFHDPNDLSLLIAVTTIISGYFLLDRGSRIIRLVWLAPIALMGVAYYFTFSRGGLLAFGVGGMVWLAVRYGGKVAIGLGALAGAALPVVLGRHADINLSGGTGQHRIQVWSDGLVQLKSFRIAFGIGEGTYADVAGLVAHNSYIHAFVEMGFFGGALFFGCFFFPVYAIFRIKKDGFPIEHPELKRMLPYVAAILGAWCIGMASLSRCYVPPTYMIVGVCAAYLNLVGFHQPIPAPLQTFHVRSAARWIACSGGLLVACFLFIKVFARYG